MSAYEDLPGHHLISIRNLIASSPDDSYPDTAGTIADDINFFMDNFTASEWDYSGSITSMLSGRSSSRQTTASPAPKTPARGITIPLGSASWSSWQMEWSTKRRAMAKTTRSPHQQTKQWCRSQHRLLRQARWRDGHSCRNSRSLKKGSKRSNGRHDCYVPRSSRNVPRAVRELRRRGASPGSGSWPMTTSTTHWT